VAESHDLVELITPAINQLSESGMECLLRVMGSAEAIRSNDPESLQADYAVVAFNEQPGLPSVISAVTSQPVIALPLVFEDDLIKANTLLEACLACDADAPVLALSANRPDVLVHWIALKEGIQLANTTVEEETSLGEELFGTDLGDVNFILVEEDEADQGEGANTFDELQVHYLDDSKPGDFMFDYEQDKLKRSKERLQQAHKLEEDPVIARQLREIEAFRDEASVKRELARGVFVEDETASSSVREAFEDDPIMEQQPQELPAQKSAENGKSKVTAVLLSPGLDSPNEETLDHLHDTILAGGVISFPTDTVFGLACDATNSAAVEKIYDIKGRDKNKPLVLMIRKIPDDSQPLIEAFWPGALTLIFERPARMFDYISEGPTLGVRIPDDPFLLELLCLVARPLAVTSANLSGEPPGKTHHEVLEQLGSRVEAIVKGECSPDAVVSTVLDVSKHPFRVLRAGALSADALREKVGVEITE
jgi:L-threonylcarbamoyladenylate synthase